MSKMSRDKGAAYERAVVNWLRAHGHPFAERNGIGFEGRDVLGVPGVSIECKNHKSWRVQEWWRQTVTQADGEQAGTLPLLIVKWPGASDVGESLAVMRLSDLAPLLGDT
jgi:Holliday junction resolvase